MSNQVYVQPKMSYFNNKSIKPFITISFKGYDIIATFLDIKIKKKRKDKAS